MLDLAIWPASILSKETERVEVFDSEIKFLSEQMFETMYAHKGIGLAAPQVHLINRMLVMDCGEPKVMCNPEITGRSETMVKTQEGCLSFPGFLVDVDRCKEILVRYQSVEGVFIEERFTGLSAICIQHEVDHLDGITFLKYISRAHRRMIKKSLEKRQGRESI